MKTETKTRKARILQVRIERKFDESPDTSHMGEYMSNPPLSGYCVDRKEGQMIDARTGEVVADGLGKTWDRNEYQYISGFQHHGLNGWEHVSDDGVHSGYLNCRYRFNQGKNHRRAWQKNLFEYYGVMGWETAQTREEKIRVLNIVYCCSDAERLENLQKGDWCYYGVIAKAEIVSTQGICQVIHSGGLWGIESDSDEAYFAEIEREQLSELKDELIGIGLSDYAIRRAFKNVAHKEG